MEIVFPHLTKGSLLSVEKLCDADYKVTFRKQDFIETKYNKVRMQGKRNKKNILYYLNLNEIICKNNKEYMNYILPKTTSDELTKFLRGALLYTTKIT